MFTKRGFTLIEVLVVVVIIGILAGVGMREYRRSVLRAEAAEASMLIGAVRDAMTDYGTEFGSCPSGNWSIAAIANEALEFYKYEASGCEVTIEHQPGRRGLNAKLTLNASADGLPQSLSCTTTGTGTENDCDVFSPFGCSDSNAICNNFI